MAIVGVLLAAGRGERFGGDKLLAKVGYETDALAPAAMVPGVAGELESDPAYAGVGATACRRLISAVAEVVAVVRPGDSALASALAATGARVVVCANAAEGMGASLACGVSATGDADGWVVALADMPWIRPDSIAQVARAIAQGGVLAAPFYRGERGHPVGFGRPCGVALRALGGDEGARTVVAAHRATLLRIDVDDPGVLRDVDTPQDLV